VRRLLVLSAILLLVAGTAFGQEKKSPYQGYLDRALEYFQANEYDRAIREISKVLFSKNTEELAAAYYVRGACQRQKGDLQAAAADLEKALQYKKDWLSPLEILGVVYAADADAAVRMQKGLPSLSRAAVLQSKSPAVYEALARLSVERKNLAQAVRWLDLALHWGAEAFSLLETDPGLGVLRDTEYGRVLLAHRKEYQEARATFKQAIEAGNRNDHARALDLLGRCIPGLVASVGPGGAALGEAHFNLGLSHALRGAFGEAIEPYEKALAIRVEMQGARSIGAAEIHKCIAAALANAGDAARALAHYREVLAIMVALFGENDPGTAQACEQAGTLLARLGDHAQAISYHERALAIRARVLGAAHPDTLTSMEKIAGVLSERGDHEKAIALGQKALDLRLAAAEGVPTRALADSYEVLALICMRKKDYLKAVSLLT
jgi:tetratricopeptide (TPR) repeat protein